jgi:DNA polymerase/3'-5' exonuclease PolX
VSRRGKIPIPNPNTTVKKVDFMLSQKSSTSSEKIEYCEAMGSFRRRAPTIGDLDFAVACESPEHALNTFLKFPEIKEIVSQGEKKASVVL